MCVRSASNHSDWESWYRLCGIRFERLQLDGSVEGLSLSCRELYPSGQQDSTTCSAPATSARAARRPADRLRNRLGLQAIEKLGCRDETPVDCAAGQQRPHPGKGDEHAPRRRWRLRLLSGLS
ncbi:MAG: hypothetical protein R3E50_12865 [Halioglobus sp.]